MKKIRIPFSLTEFRKGGYQVETKDNNKVRIICTDKKDKTFPLVGLVSAADGVEEERSFTESGIENDYETNLMLVKTEYEKGDILIDLYNYKCFIVKAVNERIYDYCSYSHNIKMCRQATEEEQKQLFEDLEKNGKRWNAENKCIEDVKKEEFKPMQLVLMRHSNGGVWQLCQYTYSLNMSNGTTRYRAVGGIFYEYCIPYNEKTMHLLGTDQYYEESEELE